MAQSKTIDNKRYYKCKSCGSNTEECLDHWKKKPQKKKNVCPDCIRKAKLARQVAEERAYDAGYEFISKLPGHGLRWRY